MNIRPDPCSHHKRCDVLHHIHDYIRTHNGSFIITLHLIDYSRYQFFDVLTRPGSLTIMRSSLSHCVSSREGRELFFDVFPPIATATFFIQLQRDGMVWTISEPYCRLSAACFSQYAMRCKPMRIEPIPSRTSSAVRSSNRSSFPSRSCDPSLMMFAIHAHYNAAHGSSPTILHIFHHFHDGRSTFTADNSSFSVKLIEQKVHRCIFPCWCLADLAFAVAINGLLLLASHVLTQEGHY